MCLGTQALGLWLLVLAKPKDKTPQPRAAALHDPSQAGSACATSLKVMHAAGGGCGPSLLFNHKLSTLNEVKRGKTRLVKRRSDCADTGMCREAGTLSQHSGIGGQSKDNPGNVAEKLWHVLTRPAGMRAGTTRTRLQGGPDGPVYGMGGNGA